MKWATCWDAGTQKWLCRRRWAEQYGVPRAVAVEFPYGHPLGLPGHREMQTRVIQDALRVLAEAKGPNTIVHLEHAWPEEEAHWRRQWQPTSASPLIAKYLEEIRSCAREG